MNPESLATTIFVTTILCFLCWLYHSTILPSIRYGLRLSLFRLRDELRQLVMDGDLQENDEAFYILDADLSNMISGVSRYDVTTARVPITESDKQKVQEFVRRRHELICTHRLSQIRRIDGEALSIMSSAFVLNSLVISLVILPFFLVAAFVREGINKCVFGMKAMFYNWMARASIGEEDSPLTQYLRVGRQPLPASRHGH